MSVSEATRAKALSALEGMRGIVRREMCHPGAYVEADVSNPVLAAKGAICGGRKHCAVGSLWVGGGIRPKVDEYGDLVLPGVYEEERRDFLIHRPGLRLAYDSLNNEAQAFINGHDVEPNEIFSAPIEALFEAEYNNGLTKRDLLSIIAAAKRRVLKA